MVKMKSNKLLTAMIAIFILSVPVTYSHAQMRRGEGMMRGRMMERGNERCFGDRKFMRNILKLSDDQLDQIGKINERYRDILVDFRNRLQPKKLELREALMAQNPDLDRIRSYLKDISEIEVELRIVKIKQSLEIEKIFTPDQRELMRKERRMNRD